VRILIFGLLVVVAILVAIPAGLLLTGTVDTSSLKMVLNVMSGRGGEPADEAMVKQQLQVPEGFEVSLYAADLPSARYMEFSASGDLIVSRPHAGEVILLQRDADNDGRPDGRKVLLEGLNRPLGLALYQGWLYVAESDRVGRTKFDASTGQIAGALQTVVTGLTDEGNHWSKTIGFGPDGLLYLSQGSTCNVCEEDDQRRATIMVFPPEGGEGEMFATGLRNSVGFDWAPWNGELYATDNGRDLLGDDFPPCELNKLEAGKFYGWPYFNGANIEDPDMGPDPLAAQRQPTAPVHDFRPHNAPLGLGFANTEAWPKGYERVALAALHGSWNRSTPDGYKVVSLHWTDSGIEERDFLWGFLADGHVSGRPVDAQQGPDGAIYVSDDYGGAIYRVSVAR
jgi:glucose/arabinose dehydrogenase